MKKLNFYFTFSLIFCATFFCAQNNFKKTNSDFNKLIGSWKGSLTYLDYSSGKPYTMAADIDVTRIKNTDKFIISNIYPNEKSANSTDTISIAKNGSRINEESVESRRKLSDGTVQITTETEGKDGNENKSAIIKHTYIFGDKTYNIIKEIRFLDSKEWIKRHEYSYKKS